MMIPKKIKVAFKGVNRLYMYVDDQYDLSPGDVVYVEGKMWRNPGQVIEVIEDSCADGTQYNKILKKLNVEIHGTYYSYGPYMLCFDREAIPFEQFKSWVSPPQREKSNQEQGFDFILDELGYCEFATENALYQGMRCFEEERVEFLSLINGRGQALVKDGLWHTVTFNYDGKKIQNIVCQSDPSKFCEHDIGTCLTLRSLLQVFHNEFSEYDSKERFTAVNRSLFYKIAAYSLKKITL